LPRGEKLAATDLGLLAAAGVGSVTVKRRIKIVFFSTGDELLPLGETLATGKYTTATVICWPLYW